MPQIGDGGLHALCEVLKANPFIIHLNCSYDSITMCIVV